MKVSLNWAKDLAKRYSDIDLIDVPTDELVKLATERLGGIEGVTDLSKHYEGIVVAKVVSCVKHPNADKLSLCKIDDDGAVKDVARDENGYVQVVCGAPNVREGISVAWIPPQAIVPASYGEKELFVLEARDLRGELSNGMLASPAELGMSDDHSGILEVDEDAKPGTPFKELYDLDDTILEIENKMFTHRPDGFGQLGVARELAGIQHKAFKSPDWYLNPLEVKLASGSSAHELNVKIEAEDLCPRYMAVVLEDIELKPSPIWLQSYLKRVGVRPINNVVDITNYMMLETAQPLHAFDFDKVAKGGAVNITVRRPRENEKMTLLDGKEIQPHKDAALICNDDSPIALGGVMGGGNSEIDENTKCVVLECATFNMYNIRKTSMIHGIFTDAVTRFNKGQPAAQLPSVLGKAVEMLTEFSNAKPASEIIDVVSPTTNHQSLTTNPYIEVETKFINDRLGSKFTDEEIVTMLTNVEFEAHVASGPISVTAPFWRTDIEIPEDIVEEIGRMYGFNRLPLTLPRRDITPVQPEPVLQLKKSIRNTLSRAGANEALNYSFVHGNLLQKARQDTTHAYKLRNALSPDLQYYRLSITPSLLDKVHLNIKDGFDSFALFELGKVHYMGEMDEDEPEVPNEDNHLAFVVAYSDKVSPKGASYFQAKEYLAQIAPELIDSLIPLSQFDLSTDEWAQQLTAPYEFSRSAVIVRDDQIWGIVGEFKPEVCKAFKLPPYSAGFEVHLDVLSQPTVRYTSLSKYPSTDQDITLKVVADLPFAALKELFETELTASEYHWTLVPLGIFQEEGSETRNITFRITLTHPNRTLTTKEVSGLIETLAQGAEQQFNAEQI